MNIEQLVKTYLEKKKKLEQTYLNEKNKIMSVINELQKSKIQTTNKYTKNQGYDIFIKSDIEKKYINDEQDLLIKSDELDKKYDLELNELDKIENELLERINRLLDGLYEKIGKITQDIGTLKTMLITSKKSDKNLYLKLDEMHLEKYRTNKEITKYQKYLEIINEQSELKHYISVKKEKKVNNILKALDERNVEDDTLNRKIKLEKIVDNILEKIDEKEIEPQIKENKVKEEIADETENNKEAIVNQELNEDVEIIPDYFKNIKYRKEEYNSEDNIEPIESIEEVENLEELLNLIYKDIVNYYDGIQEYRIDYDRTDDAKIYLKNNYVDLEKEEDKLLELSSKIYLNTNDIYTVIKKYVEQNKGRTFKVKELGRTVDINGLGKVKDALRKNSALKLTKEGKLSFFDIKKVYGEEQAEEYFRQIDVMDLRYNKRPGYHINKKDVLLSLKELFENNKSSWIKNYITRDNIKEKNHKSL